MDPELKRQLEIEAQEEFINAQRKRKAELDRKYEEDDARALAAQKATQEAEQKRKDSELKIKELRERVAREREEQIWAEKEKIFLTPKLSRYICRRVASGEMLKAICEEAAMPTFEKVQDWFDDPQFNWFHADYLRATTLRNRAFEDDIVIIADDSTNDYIEKVNTKTGETFRAIDPEALTRSKMRIDSRLRVMKANDPSRWGDNPNAGEATRKLLENMRPIVQMNFIEAPKEFAMGSDARITIEATAFTEEQLEIERERLRIRQEFADKPSPAKIGKPKVA